MSDTESDQQLLHRVREHDDREAFASLVRRYQSPVRLFLRRLCANDHAWADDLAQDTFILAHQLRHRCDPTMAYQSWLFALAHNLHRNSARKERLRTLADEVPESLAETAPATSGHESLSFAVNQLSPEQQQVIHLHYLQQVPQAEVAQVLDMPLNTVKSHLARAKIRLKELLSSKPYV